MHKNAINMLEGVKKILLWRIFERNLAKFFCGAFLSTFWPNCGAFRRKIISHTEQCVGAWQSETSWFSLLCEKTLKIPTFPHMWYLVKNQRIFYYLSSNTAFLIKMKWIYLWFFNIFQSGNSAIRKLFSIQHSVSWNVIRGKVLKNHESPKSINFLNECPNFRSRCK